MLFDDKMLLFGGITLVFPDNKLLFVVNMLLCGGKTLLCCGKLFLFGNIALLLAAAALGGKVLLFDVKILLFGLTSLFGALTSLFGGLTSLFGGLTSLFGVEVANLCIEGLENGVMSRFIAEMFIFDKFSCICCAGGLPGGSWLAGIDICGSVGAFFVKRTGDPVLEDSEEPTPFKYGFFTPLTMFGSILAQFYNKKKYFNTQNITYKCQTDRRNVKTVKVTGVTKTTKTKDSRYLATR